MKNIYKNIYDFYYKSHCFTESFDYNLNNEPSIFGICFKNNSKYSSKTLLPSLHLAETKWHMSRCFIMHRKSQLRNNLS